MQCLWAKHHIDERRPAAHRISLLTCDTATDTDQHTGPLFFQLTPHPEVREDLFLGLLAYRAGVEQQHVGLFRPVGRFHPVTDTEHVQHTAGIVLVHLAPECLDVNLARHRQTGYHLGKLCTGSHR